MKQEECGAFTRAILPAGNMRLICSLAAKRGSGCGIPGTPGSPRAVVAVYRIDLTAGARHGRPILVGTIVMNAVGRSAERRTVERSRGSRRAMRRAWLAVMLASVALPPAAMRPTP